MRGKSIAIRSARACRKRPLRRWPWRAMERRMGEASWLVFVVASLVLIVTPGQDMILVLSRSVAQGAAAGVATAAGVSVGLVGHTALAALGLGALLRASEWLFIALK